MRQPTEDPKVFLERRKKLASLIPGSALILTSHPDYIRNNDVHHAYRQDSNFYYLTGFEEPQAIFMMLPGQNPESILFVREKNIERETWDGFRYGPEMAKESFLVDAAYTIHEFEEVAAKFLDKANRLYCRLFQFPDFDDKIKKLMQRYLALHSRSGKGVLPIEDSGSLLGEMRLIKSVYEIKTLQKACDISAQAHVDLMKAARPGMNERTLHGLFIKSIMEKGAKREGYGTIVAGGHNATTLHYTFNDQDLRDGDLVLIDAGAEYNYFTGDITRTFPVNGKFTPVQRRIYERVLDVQKRLIASIKPGLPFDRLQEQAVSELVDIMLDEKLLKGTRAEIIKSRTYTKYYPHGIGHWLGMDVHDTGLRQINGESRLLEPGMCFTIEPGLYIPATDTEAPAELRGLGIRIEDNIVVTESGHEVLTSAVPKDVEAIEALGSVKN